MDPQGEELLNIIRSLSARCGALAQENAQLRAHYEAKIQALQREKTEPQEKPDE